MSDPSSQRPLVFALAVDEQEQFLIIESSTPAGRSRVTPKVHGPMTEERVRAVLANDFGMEPEAIEGRVESARKHRREP